MSPAYGTNQAVQAKRLSPGIITEMIAADPHSVNASGCPFTSYRPGESLAPGDARRRIPSAATTAT
jgi:hypothetical protein